MARGVDTRADPRRQPSGWAAGYTGNEAYPPHPDSPGWADSPERPVERDLLLGRPIAPVSHRPATNERSLLTGERLGPAVEAAHGNYIGGRKLRPY